MRQGSNMRARKVNNLTVSYSLLPWALPLGLHTEMHVTLHGLSSMQERDGTPCALDFEFSWQKGHVLETALLCGCDLNEQTTQYSLLRTWDPIASVDPMIYVTVDLLQLHL